MKACDNGLHHATPPARQGKAQHAGASASSLSGGWRLGSPCRRHEGKRHSHIALCRHVAPFERLLKDGDEHKGPLQAAGVYQAGRAICCERRRQRRRRAMAA